METTNHESYVSSEVTELLTKAGFYWQDYFVTHNISGRFHWEIPLHIAQKWLREVKDIHLYVRVILFEHKYVVTVVINDSTWGQVNDSNGKAKKFNTYEEALEAGIKKALEIILEKENKNYDTI